MADPGSIPRGRLTPPAATVNKPHPTRVGGRLLSQAWEWQVSVVLETGTEFTVYGVARTRGRAQREQDSAAVRLLDTYQRSWDEAADRVVLLTRATFRPERAVRA